jgi:hypothetical protein
MSTRNTGILAWAAVTAAVAAWIGVFMYDSWISAQLEARSSQTTDVQSVSEKEVAAVRLHVLARDTANQRTQLDSLTNTDIISVADIIEGIGKIAVVQLKIGAATPETTVQKKGAANTPASSIVGFVVEASGAFASVMHAAALLESLPVPSSVQNLEFENIMSSSDAKSSKSTWHLTARVRVLIASGI